MKATFTTEQNSQAEVAEALPELTFTTRSGGVLYYQASIATATQADRLIAKAKRKGIAIELNKIGADK